MDRSGPIAFLFSPENRRWTLTIIVAIAALAAFLLLYDRDGSTEAGTTPTDPAATTGLEAASGTTGSGDEGGSTDPGDIGDLPIALTSDQCMRFATALSLAITGGVGAGGEFDSSQVDEAFARMRQVAPPEIADDLTTIAAGFAEFYSALEQAGVDLEDPGALSTPAAIAALEQAGQALESSGFEEAADNVNAWLDSTCTGF